jgi:KDO2-lipid IV(A) lauroyltransferase
MYYVVRYRRAIVAKNLRLSFPEKTDQQRLLLERQFYRRFASTIMEIIYGYRISDEEMC